MGINNFFATVLNAPPANPRWSWGAYDSEAQRMFLRVWQGEGDDPRRMSHVEVFWPGDRDSRPGYAERERHISMIRDQKGPRRIRAYAVICRGGSHRPDQPWRIKDFERDYVRPIVGLSTEAGKVIARLGRPVSVASLATGPLEPNTILDDLDQIKEGRLRSKITETERDDLRKSRIGQGRFRDDLLRLWGFRCAVTGCPIRAILRASHLRPWSKSTDADRMDPNNGLPLIANLDALFDVGLISFSDAGVLLRSKELGVARIPGLGRDRRLRLPLNQSQRHHLAHHRDEIFKP